MDFTDISVLAIVDLLGVFVFALSGSWLATRRDFDLVGIVVLGYVTGLAGGVTRDILVGDLPPLAMVREVYLIVPALAALLVLALPKLVMRFGRPVQVLDAIGLGLFATVGAAKATEFGLGLWAATLVGVISAVGGGILRDLLAGVVPQVFGRGSQLYAIPAGLGAFLIALLWERASGGAVLMTSAIAITVVLRLAAVRFDWHAPTPRRDIGQA